MFWLIQCCECLQTNLPISIKALQLLPLLDWCNQVYFHENIVGEKHQCLQKFFGGNQSIKPACLPACVFDKVSGVPWIKDAISGRIPTNYQGLDPIESLNT